MRKHTLKIGLIAVTLLATSIASAGVDFKTNLTSYNFQSESGNVLGGHKGNFKYGTVEYGESAPNSLNLTTLGAGLTRHAHSSGTPNATYAFYKRANSVVIGNAARGLNDFNDRQFVKAVVGTPTVKSTLPTNATYDYTGVVFNHIAGTEGVLDYQVKKVGAVVTGSGSVSGISGARPTVGAFTLGGTLEQVTFNNNLKATGDATLTLVDSTGSTVLQDTKYDIGIFGPGAAEIGGGIYTKQGSTAPNDLQLQRLIGGYAFSGVKD
ncbi:factor H binding protein domain-containing protein [Acinetobacter puyangensis]|uniref:factor H binding protein domain-containing protein n=1 Tax=Acinetobacter puyangensis TaxID=1096779 RepID=UPI003A4D341C